MTKKVSKESLNISEEKIAELKKVIPEVFTEGKIDFEKLQRTLGEEINGKDEKYSFNWAGRKETFKNIQTTAKGTLKPAEKESVNWDSTENLFVEGDNLEVLKLLQKAYFNKIKMIYIDPPYNTGKDFVYKDNFKNNIQSYLEQTGQSNGDGVKLTTNPETNGRFHSDWISMIYPRLFVARNLLREDGVIFVSIDDNEVTNLRKVMDEVFGEENFVGSFTVRSNPRGSQASKLIANEHEYVLCYAKENDCFDIEGYEKKDDDLFSYNQEDSEGKYRFLGLRQRGGAWRRRDRPDMFYPIYINPKTGDVSLKKDKTYTKEALPLRPSGEESRWTWGKGKFEKDKNLLVGKRVNRNGETDFWDIFRKDYLKSEGKIATKKPRSIWDEKEVNYQNTGFSE